MIRLPKIKQIALRVKQLDNVTQFYKNVLGMTLHVSSDKEVTLGTKDRILLKLITDPSYTDPKEPVAGLYHVAYLLPERKYLASFLNHIIDERIPVEGASDHGVSEAIYLRDPEGNGIEVYVDRPKSMWPMKNGQIEMYTNAMDIADVMILKETFKGLPLGTRIGHVHHHVSDIISHEVYYKKGLGMDLVLQYGGSASFLSYDGYHHHVGINVWKGRGIHSPKKTDFGLDVVTMSYEHASDIEKIANQLSENNYLVNKQDGNLYTEDPSGHGWLLVLE